MTLPETARLGEVTSVEPLTVWGREVDFSAWLSKNLDRPSTALKLGDLEFTDLEAPVGAFRCDIVAKEIGSDSGRVIVIENQFGKTDHDHLGKLLTYAAKFQAQIVVWISTDVREEHRSAIEWLNSITPDEVGFFAVQLSLISIDDSLPAPILEARSSPTVGFKPESRNKNNSIKSPTNEAYRAFFQGVIDELRDKHQFTNARLGQPQSWYKFTSGVAGFYYYAEFSLGEKLRAGLYIDAKDKETNEARFKALCARRAYIEGQLGFSLDWEFLENKKICRIRVTREDSSIDRPSSEMAPWLVERLLKLREVLNPFLQIAALEADKALLVASTSSPIEGA